MKLIIAGSRSITKYSTLKFAFSRFKYRTRITAVISGDAKGVDSLGNELALNKGFKLLRRPADWEQYGKSAGYIRNAEMLKEADCLLAIWDCVSKGTLHMIKIAVKAGVYVEVYNKFGRKLDIGVIESYAKY